MNTPQEALDNIKNKEVTELSDSGTSWPMNIFDADDKDIATLQELVDRKTYLDELAESIGKTPVYTDYDRGYRDGLKYIISLFNGKKENHKNHDWEAKK